MAGQFVRPFRRQPGSSAIARRRRILSDVFLVESLETRRLLSTYTLNTSLSSVTISGYIDSTALTAQSAPAAGLSDSYTGSIDASIVGTNIEISSGSTVTATDAGATQPDGTPANYGADWAGTDVAIRGLAFDLSGDISIQPGGVFTGAGTVTIPSGAEIDLSPLGVPISQSLAGSLSGDANSNVTGSVASADGTITLTLPFHENFDQTVDGFALNLNFDGQFVLTSAAVVTATLSNNTLTVVGTPGPDNISISDSDGNIVVDDDGNLVNSFAADDVLSISVLGGLGADSISIGAGVPPTFVGGSYGADTITAANGAGDTLSGGKGADSINDADSTGDDLLQGGMGPDTLLAGSGNDTMHGGMGADSITGGSGDNVLDPGLGTNTIHGGSGFETIDGSTGVNTIVSGPHDTVLSAPLLNVDFTVNDSDPQLGFGVVGDTSDDYWNPVNNSELVNSGANGADSGSDDALLYSNRVAAQGVTMTYHADGAFDTTNGGPFANEPALENLMRTYIISYGTGGSEGSVEFQGLTPGNYNVYLYSSGNYQGDNRQSVFEIGDASATATFENVDTLVEGTNYVEIPAFVASDGSMVIYFAQGAVGGEADLNAIQLQPAAAT